MLSFRIFVIDIIHSVVKKVPGKKKLVHTIIGYWTAYSFDYATHLELYCFNTPLQCLDLFPSSVALSFPRDIALMMVESECCIKRSPAYPKDSQRLRSSHFHTLTCQHRVQTSA